MGGGILAGALSVRAEPVENAVRASSDAGEALRYPLTGRFWWAIFLVVVALSQVPWLGYLSWAVSLYYMVKTIEVVAAGSHALPDLPAPSRLADEMGLWGRAIVVSLLVLWPITAIHVMWLVQRFEPSYQGSNALLQICLFATCVFIFFFPLALGAVALGDSIVLALTPSRMGGIRKQMGDGFAAVAIMVALGGFVLLIAVGLLSKLGVVGEVAGRVVSFYGQLVLAYTVGASLRRREVPAPQVEPSEPAPEDEGEPASEAQPEEASPADEPITR